MDNVLSTMSQAAKLGGGLLMSTVNANKSRLAAALATMEHYTRLLLPQEQVDDVRLQSRHTCAHITMHTLFAWCRNANRWQTQLKSAHK